MDKTEKTKYDIERGMKYAPITPARKIALGIFADISDRKGLKQELAVIDREVIDEIIASWEEIARVVIAGEI